MHRLDQDPSDENPYRSPSYSSTTAERAEVSRELGREPAGCGGCAFILVALIIIVLSGIMMLFVASRILD